MDLVRRLAAILPLLQLHERRRCTGGLHEVHDVDTGDHGDILDRGILQGVVELGALLHGNLQRLVRLHDDSRHEEALVLIRQEGTRHALRGGDDGCPGAQQQRHAQIQTLAEETAAGHIGIRQRIVALVENVIERRGDARE